MFLILLLYMLFASTFTIGKAALSYTTPIFLIAIRMLLGGLLLVCYQYFCNYKVWRFKWVDRWSFLQITLFQYYGAFILEFLALQWLSSAKACLIYNLAPFVTALISFFLLHERLTIKQWIGLAIGFVGFMPILLTTTPTEELAGSIFLFSTPELLQLGSVLCACYGWIVFNTFQSSKGYNIITINAFCMTLAGCFALITSLVCEGFPVIIPPKDCASYSLPWLCSFFTTYFINGAYMASVAIFMFYTLLLIIIANLIGFNLYGYLLSKYTPTFLSFCGSITPLFAALFGCLFLQESIGLPFFLTLIMVFCGLLLFYQDELDIKKNA